MPVLAGQADGLAAVLIDQRHDFLVHQAAQHHFHQVHGVGVCNAHALDELALLADAAQQFIDLRATTMHHHWIDAHQLQHHHVLGEAFFQGRVRHRVATVLDHQGLAGKTADIRQGFGKYQGFFCCIGRHGILHGCARPLPAGRKTILICCILIKPINEL